MHVRPVDAAGRRCESTAFLQLHHETPWAAGGDARPDNIRVLCRAHNRLRAELDFGREHIDRHVAQAKAAFGANRECGLASKLYPEDAPARLTSPPSRGLRRGTQDEWHAALPETAELGGVNQGC